MIGEFRGNTKWLSNFYLTPVRFEGIIYPSSEHAYQAAKTLDMGKRREIAALKKCGDAKRVGRDLALRDDWEEVRLNVMECVVRDKFRRNPYLTEKLLSTGTVGLREGNDWCDNFWGNCFCEKCRNITGRNHLGILLMMIRNELRGYV